MEGSVPLAMFLQKKEKYILSVKSGWSELINTNKKVNLTDTSHSVRLPCASLFLAALVTEKKRYITLIFDRHLAGCSCGLHRRHHHPLRPLSHRWKFRLLPAIHRHRPHRVLLLVSMSYNCFLFVLKVHNFIYIGKNPRKLSEVKTAGVVAWACLATLVCSNTNRIGSINCQL